MSASEHGSKDKESENQGSIGMPEKGDQATQCFYYFLARVLPLGYKIIFQCDSYKGFYFFKNVPNEFVYLKSPYLDNRLEHVTKI
jgi:hypothetical protein